MVERVFSFIYCCLPQFIDCMIKREDIIEIDWLQYIEMAYKKIKKRKKKKK